MVEQTPSNNTVLSDKNKTTHPVKKFFRKLALFFLLLCAITMGITFLVFNFTYSEGNRAGMLIKFSTKGYVFKTYEGELNVGSVSTTAGATPVNNTWAFSVKDKALAKRLSLMEGKMVRLHYKEKIRNLPWQGETKYFVDNVVELK